MDMNRKLLEILLDPQGGNRTGILRIEKGTAKKQLVLRNGAIAFAESNVPEEHLARIMVSINLLPRAKLSEVGSSMKTGMTSEEAVLAVTDSNIQSLQKARREQAMTIMISLLTLNDCELRFFPGDGLVRYQVGLDLKAPELIAISVRQAISKRIFRIPPQFLSGSFIFCERFADQLQAFALNEAERHACSLLNQHMMKASDLLRLISADAEKPEETLYCLYLLGLISFDTGTFNSVEQELEDMLAQFKKASFYEILSVPSDSKTEEIQNAYHEKAKQLHPDRFQSAEFSAEIRSKAEQIFSCVNEAYLTLRNPGLRSTYDTNLHTKKMQSDNAKSGTVPPEIAAAGLFLDGKALLARGEFDAAVDRLKGCVWLCPEKAVYQHFLGVAESRNPKLRKSAEQHFLRAIELEDVSADSHLELAKLYIEVKLPKRAEIEVEKAIFLDPENSEARRLSAELKKTC